MWVLIALVGLVLVMSRQARVESRASANRVAAVEAAAAARAGEQYVLAQVELAAGDAVAAQTVQADMVPVGAAYFWIVRPDREDDRQPDFGIDDEGSKVNLNTASRDQLGKLPGMTTEVADSIIDWRDEDENPGENGAESTYYGALPRPYRCKNAPFETAEELLLVRGVTPELLYGYDANRNGLLDPDEAAASGTVGTFSSATSASDPSPRGLLPFVSVHGAGAPAQPTTTTGTGTGGTGTGGQTGGTGAQTQAQNALVNVNGQNTQAVLDVLRNALTTDRFNEVAPRVAQGRPFANLLDFYVKTTLTAEEFAQVDDQLGTTNNPNPGWINVNTASREVLRTMVNIEDAEAATLVSARDGGADTSSIAWVAQALPRERAVAVAGQMTGRTYRFSADVVGVSGDGRAYQRVRIVVDASQAPPRIVYRRDLTGAGWPLPEETRMMLRSGQGQALPGGGAFGAGTYR